MDKTFTIVGVSTQGKVTKFRTANGDVAQRVKVLTRNGHTDVDLVVLDAAMSKADAIAAYIATHPEAAAIKVTGEKEVKPAREPKVKTVSIKKGSKKTTDAATELLKAVEATETASEA